MRFISERMLRGARALVFLIGGAEGMSPATVARAGPPAVALARSPFPTAWPA
jgi:23S rRNA pseudoU1915 N3-methylase RlmH